MTFKEKIRQGYWTRKRIATPTGTQHCLNCGKDYDGSYCPHCGQSHATHRITWGNFWRNFVMNGIGLQGTLPHTIIELFYRPGYLIRDYLAGKRQHYTNPFRMLLLTAAIFVLFNGMGIGGNIKESAAELSMAMNTEENMTAQDTAAVNEVTQGMMDTMYSNFGTFNLLLILTMTVPFWIAFRRAGQYRNQPLNISEAATAMAFVGCQNMVVNLFSLPFIQKETMGIVTTIGYIIVIPLFFLTLRQMFDMKWTHFLVRNFIFTALFLLFYLLFTTLIVMYVVVGQQAG